VGRARSAARSQVAGVADRVTSIAAYRSQKELYINLALRELRSKYKRSFLGWAWSLVNPLAILLVYTIVFKLFLKVKPEPGVNGLDVFALWLLCAMLPFAYFQNSVMGSIGSLTGNANLIKKTYFPRELLPSATVGANIVFHAIEMGLLLVALLAFGDWEAVEYLPFVLLLMATMAVFALGFGLLLSALNVYFRDIEHFMAIFFLIWLYMTPIIYPTTLPGVQRFLPILKLNPMTDATLSYRDVLYYGTHPGWLELGYFIAWAVGMFFLGRVVFNKLEPGLAEEL
jgi:ABC-type polysaccharide/polyol phosphate export permease